MKKKGSERTLSQEIGAYHYTVWKMAVTFPPEIFAQGFGVEVYPGEETFRLPIWLLWYISSLAELYPRTFESKVSGSWYNDKRDKAKKSRFERFLRLTSSGKLFHGFYVFIRLLARKDKKNLKDKKPKIHKDDVRMNQLQNIWSHLEHILNEEEFMPIPDYPKIVGFAGLLLPLAQGIERDKEKSEHEKRRAISKLLDNVDRPIQFSYTAAKEQKWNNFIFCKQPDNTYFFEKALDLLKWSGEDVNKLLEEGKERVGKNAKFSWAWEKQVILIGPDRINRVTANLRNEGEKPFENEADWRGFAYQVKLALWSMFPEYLGSES
ncbi:MAG: hypothetical protein HQK57_06685 [Deltaproteobacteria bacterium]|nr:hypothetical protein [Deltaproteobacteria bacterium]